jgi:protein-tyrosine-phosphatase
VSSVLRVNIALERVGDYAVTLCREMVRLSQRPDQRVIRNLEISVEPAKQSLRQALEAFQDGNADLARGTREMASHLASTFDKVFADLVDEGEAGQVPIRDLLALLLIFNRLSRVCDQAKNICEETVFVAVGETKPPKRFRILFVDEKNDCFSQMAVAIAQKNYADRAHFSSAGWNPAPELKKEFVAFMETRGHDFRDVKPAKLELVPEVLCDYHIVVNLGDDLRRFIASPPCHTVVLEWQDEITSLRDAVEEGGSVKFEEIYADLALKMANLMEILTGEDSSSDAQT